MKTTIRRQPTEDNQPKTAIRKQPSEDSHSKTTIRRQPFEDNQHCWLVSEPAFAINGVKKFSSWSVKKRLWGTTSKVNKDRESKDFLQKPKKKTAGNFDVLAPKTEILAILARPACFLAFVLSHERKNEEKNHERKN